MGLAGARDERESQADSIGPDDQQDGPRVSVIIPTLNEERNLPHVLPRLPQWVHEVIIVDGHSTDRTVELARELWPPVKVINQPGRGKGDALNAGFRAATGDIIVTLDADGSMDPAELPAFVGVLMAGADFVKGSRFMQGGGTDDMEVHRRIGNWGLTMLVRMCFGCRFTDLCYGYNAFRYDVLPVLMADVDGFEIETSLNVRALKAKLKVAEVPSFEAPRIHGVSNLHTYADGWRVLRTILTERFHRDQPMVGVHAAGDPDRDALAPVADLSRPPAMVGR